VQKPHPPIWIGGHSRAALKRVARLGDGWHPVGANPASPLRPPEMRAKLDELRSLMEAEGRDYASLTISYKAPLYDATVAGGSLGGDGERRPFAGNRKQILADIEVYSELGVSDLILDFRAETLQESIDRMERFADWVGLKTGAPAVSTG
jgi:alkanesulfonate monooxygenase SsuD/methylene tetrahydromethanopterin reductase-like flavin-dependent oxidoreductase (luciferase family)